MEKSILMIDGIKCYLPVQSLSETADDWYSYADRTEDGTMHMELIGTYFNYNLKFLSPWHKKDEHDKLWNLVNQGKEFSTIKSSVMNKGKEFEAYFAQKKNDLRRVYGEDNYFTNLSFNIIQRRPSIKPKGVIIRRR